MRVSVSVTVTSGKVAKDKVVRLILENRKDHPCLAIVRQVYRNPRVRYETAVFELWPPLVAANAEDYLIYLQAVRSGGFVFTAEVAPHDHTDRPNVRRGRAEIHPGLADALAIPHTVPTTVW